MRYNTTVECAFPSHTKNLQGFVNFRWTVHLLLNTFTTSVCPQRAYFPEDVFHSVYLWLDRRSYGRREWQCDVVWSQLCRIRHLPTSEIYCSPVSPACLLKVKEAVEVVAPELSNSLPVDSMQQQLNNHLFPTRVCLIFPFCLILPFLRCMSRCIFMHYWLWDFSVLKSYYSNRVTF